MWTREHEKLLLQWKDQCVYRKDTYLLAAVNEESWSRWITLPAIAVNITTATVVFSDLEKNCKGTLWIEIVTGLLLVAAAVLTGVLHHFRFDKKAGQFRNLARDYGRIIRHIDLNLTHTPDNRPPVQTFLTNLEQELESIERDFLPVPDRIRDAYVQSLREKETQTAIFGDIDTVTIPVNETNDPIVPVDDTTVDEKADMLSLQEELQRRIQQKLMQKKHTVEEYQLRRYSEPTSST